MDEKAYLIERHLKLFREKEAKIHGIPLFHIFTNDTIERIAIEQPKNKTELLNIKGIGHTKVKQYGDRILSITNDNSLHQSIQTQPSIRHEYTTEEKELESGQKQKERIYSVSEFLDHFNSSFSRKPLAIHGEIYDSVDRRGQNCYFKIKDRNDEAVLSCYMRSSVEERLGVTIETGTEIIISGFLGVYKPSGRFSLTVTHFVVRGEGLLQKAFEELSERLKQEGFFAQERKRILPETINSIALITSKGSDAEKDFITHVIKRGIQIDRYDVRVEGLRSIETITHALRRINESSTHYDVVVITRGGGSLDSLQSFNSEPIARAIVGSKVPVISAVGHENDITIADLVADVRASTPTHAGKIVSEVWNVKLEKVTSYFQSLTTSMSSRFMQSEKQTTKHLNRFEEIVITLLRRREQSLSQAFRAISLGAYKILEQESFLKHTLISHATTFKNRIQTLYQTTNQIRQFITYSLETKISQLPTALEGLEKELEAHNPHRILAKGYAIVRNSHNTIVTTKNVSPQDKIDITLYDGSLSATVDKTNEHI